nr:MAG TPA: hypothetical protein [Caudoviricetes sp.]
MTTLVAAFVGLGYFMVMLAIVAIIGIKMGWFTALFNAVDSYADSRDWSGSKTEKFLLFLEKKGISFRAR